MTRHLTLPACLGALAALIFAAHAGAASTSVGEASRRPIFPEPAAMEHQVSFWTRVYVEIGMDAGFVHDDRLLGVVYESLKVSADRGTRERQIKASKRHWREVLEGLAVGKAAIGTHARLAIDRLAKALGRSPTRADFRAASGRLRFQRGQRNRFREGLVRAGAYEARFREILASFGLPQDLAYLPHVESSFNTYAYSKFGAAGMWQFMPATARRFLSLDSAVDERLDPIKATHAAARLLAHNHRRLGRWPLAITAYNHGAAGMGRARKAVGSDDIEVIVERYSGGAFGFASRNFYAQFLAARRVARASRKYFGSLEPSIPAPVHVVVLPFYADVKDLERHLNVTQRTLARLNPSLLPAVFRSERYIPRGFELRLPVAPDSIGVEALLAAIPPGRRYDAPRRSRVHVVRRGDTLGHIARRYDTSVDRLVSVNGLRSRHRIRIGQKLELIPTRRNVRTSPAAAPGSASVEIPRATRVAHNSR